MFGGWKKRQALRRAASEMSRSRREGEGVRVQEWQLTGEDLVSPSEAILSWCRDALASCRRPFGIDHFDLALAVLKDDEGGVRSRRFVGLRPLELYGERLVREIHQLLAMEGSARRATVAVALFSWGDAAHRALPPDA